jgi:hypothetical protein
MLHSRVQFSSTAALPPTLYLADCIINIAEFEFSIGQLDILPFDEPLATWREWWIHHARPMQRSLAEPAAENLLSGGRQRRNKPRSFISLIQ